VIETETNIYTAQTDEKGRYDTASWIENNKN